MHITMDSIRPIKWLDGKLHLLDQRQLPGKEVVLEFSDVAAVAKAIRDMVVRGAPAIGITAAYAIVLAAQRHYRELAVDWRSAIEADLQILASARPTAVNLQWAITEMRRGFGLLVGDPTSSLLARARAIHDQDLAANYRMGQLGAELIQQPGAIITHCNAGALATGGYGTALGVVRCAYAKGKITRVYADETRPWLQGARLTAWELVKEQIPVTLMVDSAAATIMQRGDIRWVIVGSDRIAANGDVANKIGTYGLAIAAHFHGIKFMVVAPTTTVDLATGSGAQIEIEHRSGDELSQINSVEQSVAAADVINPAFDVTPAELIDVIVTERGVIMSPNQEKLKAMMEKAG
ncbi:MAG: S-methyl-5-thioribose-1-phosphate isomerase [Thiohalomonadales bacterium]